jgi:hypothetical protein
MLIVLGWVQRRDMCFVRHGLHHEWVFGCSNVYRGQLRNQLVQWHLHEHWCSDLHMFGLRGWCRGDELHQWRLQV